MAGNTIPAPIAAACRAVRPGEAADAIGGVQPSIVAVPASTAQASALLAASAALGLAVVPRGTGSRLHWGNPPARCDIVIETAGLDRVVEHAAGDLVATVEAGVSLEWLADVLGAAGQRLALDPPVQDLPPAVDAGPNEPRRRTRGTVGGVLATGAAGPLRLRYATGRDLLIGITVVRADGTIARSGGKVVKNVAGYDLGKLFAGSRGTLGLITQATFRLHPVPATMAYLLAECAEPTQAARLIAAALDTPLAPVAAEIDWPDTRSPVRVGVALEGDESGVAERARLLAAGAMTQAGTVVSQDPPPWWGAGAAAQHDGTVLQIGCWPGDLGVVLATIRVAAEQAGLDPAVSGSAAGVLHCAVPPGARAGSVAHFVASLRGSIGEGNGHSSGNGPPTRANVVVLHAPAAVAGLVDLFGPIPSLALMRAVKHQFDPNGIMAPGRFAGGI